MGAPPVADMGVSRDTSCLRSMIDRETHAGASDTLQETELAAIIDMISALVVRYGSDGTPDFINQTWHDYTGLTLDDLKRSRWKAVHPEDRAAVAESWQEHFSAGQTFSSQLRLRSVDGNYRWHRIDLNPLRDEHGTIVSWYGVGHDVEDRQLRERLIQAAEQELRSTIDSIPSLVWQADPAGVIQYFNCRWREFAGLQREPSNRWDLQSIVHPDDGERLAAAWRERIAIGEPFELAARMRRCDDEYRRFLLRAEPEIDEFGGVVQWYGVIIDIEDRQRTEDALRDSEQRFRNFSESASDWYWETDSDHRFSYMPLERPEFQFIMEPDRIGLHRWDIAADVADEPAKWQEHMATLDAHLPFRGFTYQVRLKDGSMRYIGSSGIPRFSSDGRFVGYRGGGSDVTAAVRARQSEEALRKAQIELAHVTRATTLGELSASIAHEVNQPLTGISGNGAACLRWLARDPPRLSEARASVHAMMRECNRATSIVSRIRALAQKSPLQMAVLDMDEVVRDSVVLVQHAMLLHRVALVTELSSSPLHILGDRVQLQQVVINLILNGIEAMEEPDDRRQAMAIRSKRDDEGNVIVEFQDSGKGIDPGDMDRLFDAFFTTKKGGLGMGLSISRSIVAAHNGRLSAETAEVGAIFRIRLPAMN